jgi:hypothetical protein
MWDSRMNFHPRPDWPDAAEIAKALGGKKSGKGYSCRCPAHNDKSPSLSVTDAVAALLADANEPEGAA